MPLAMVVKVPDGATDHDLSVACMRDFFSDVQFQEEKACLFLMAIWRVFLLGSLLFANISSYSLSVCIIQARQQLRGAASESCTEELALFTAN
jgi:hypothetical protein